MIETTEQCIDLADITTDTGFPNYRMAGIHLKSGLNIAVLEENFLDKHVIQYLKFGFLISLTVPQPLHTHSASYQHSALQFSEAGYEYIPC